MKIDKKKYLRIHHLLRKTYGKAYRCESSDCKSLSNNFDYALIHGKEYEFKRENFIMLCKSCHCKYDITLEGEQKKRLSMFGRKHKVETIIKMRRAALLSNRRPPPMTKEQLEILREKMKGNNRGFKKGMIPWNKKNNLTMKNTTVPEPNCHPVVV